jgi:hypothetical protein
MLEAWPVRKVEVQTLIHECIYENATLFKFRFRLVFLTILNKFTPTFQEVYKPHPHSRSAHLHNLCRAHALRELAMNTFHAIIIIKMEQALREVGLKYNLGVGINQYWHPKQLKYM